MSGKKKNIAHGAILFKPMESDKNVRLRELKVKNVTQTS